MSILRFRHVINNASSQQTITISNCGMELNVIKPKTGKTKEEDDKKSNADSNTEQALVLTNMSFSSGVHCWEVICPISC